MEWEKRGKDCNTFVHVARGDGNIRDTIRPTLGFRRCKSGENEEESLISGQL